MDEDVALFLGESEDNLGEGIDELSVDRGGFGPMRSENGCIREKITLFSLSHFQSEFTKDCRSC
jgi:hypothetical protein